MTGSQRKSALLLFRITAAIAAAGMLILTVVIAPSTPAASAREARTAIFGTVTGTPEGNYVDIATRSGVITLKIDKSTKIRAKKGKLELSQIEAGMTVAGYFTESDDGLVAGKLTFVTREQKTTYEHVVGVVIDETDSTFTVKTSDGEQVEITAPDDPLDSPTEPGSMIAAVVEVDEETGELKATALQTAKETVDRLSEAISYEISIAQRDLLKIRMSATATVHMTRLYITLGEINAEAQAQIQAAYAEFQAGYAATMKENLIAPIALQVTGEIDRVFETEIHIQSLTDGTKWSIRITNSTVVVVFGSNSPASVRNLAAGQLVEISATPATPPDWPVADLILLLPPADPTDEPEPDDGTITGIIVVVDSDSPGDDTVIVITLDDGTDTAASVDGDTVVIVDGEELTVDQLEPGQEVEIVLGDDGFSVDEITATDPTPGPTDGTPISTPEYTLIGILRSITDGGVVLDGVQLTLNDPSISFETAVVGDQVELQFIVDDSGDLVVIGHGKKEKTVTSQGSPDSPGNSGESANNK